VNLAVLATVFAVIFVSELPDKTALASLVLGTKYRPLFVFAGVAVAFALHVVLAIAAGSLLGLLPHRLVEAIVAVLFAIGAVVMLRRREEDEPEAETAAGQDAVPTVPVDGGAPALTGEPADGGSLAVRLRAPAETSTPSDRRPGFWKVAGTSFAVLFVAEFGDLTQIATANLAARYHDPLAVGIGATLGLWAVGGLAVVGGRQLLRVVPMQLIIRIAAAAMGVLAVLSLVSAIRG
jgi:putative Ca2+/H+ antiporter (TMEM165/GDT1 family)